MLGLVFRVDDLSGEATQALVRRHLAGMYEITPAKSVHAFDVAALRRPDVTFWTGWLGEQVAVMGALRRLDAANGEIKSMRVADAFRGQGAGRAMLDHIVAAAKRAGMRTLWLETGSGPPFEPALQLYRRAGFVPCGPFADYRDDPFSRFMTRAI